MYFCSPPPPYMSDMFHGGPVICSRLVDYVHIPNFVCFKYASIGVSETP